MTELGLHTPTHKSSIESGLHTPKHKSSIESGLHTPIVSKFAQSPIAEYVAKTIIPIPIIPNAIVITIVGI